MAARPVTLRERHLSPRRIVNLTWLPGKGKWSIPEIVNGAAEDSMSSQGE